MKNIKYILKHLSIIAGITIIAIIGLFYFFLPSYTHHGVSITVPNVEGVAYKDIEPFLTKRNLRYTITADSGYSSSYPPLTVLKQFPKPETKVKEDRKIYLTLNAANPPKTEMPNLIGGSLKSAQIVLKTKDLKIGEIKYVPDEFSMTVNAQKINGVVIKAGDKIPKGSTIDLEVGDGKGRAWFRVPDLVGLDLEEAEFSVIGQGLRIRKVWKVKGVDLETDSAYLEYLNNKGVVDANPETVFKQSPKSGEKIKVGSPMDIWIVDKPSLSID